MDTITTTTPVETFKKLSDTLVQLIGKRTSNPFHIALPGGEGMAELYQLWSSEYRQQIPWNNLRFYWTDGQCSAEKNGKSGFSLADQLLFIPLNIPTSHIHRIFCEHDPQVEAQRYSEIIKWELPGYSELPRFDCIILEVGAIGQVASVFPSSPSLLSDKHSYVAAKHPFTGEMYITMTGPQILQGKNTLAFLSGEEKKTVMEQIVEHKNNTPADILLHQGKNVKLFTDISL